MPERRIATVLMLDVVDSTRVAAQLGDARYRELSSRFNRIVRAGLKRFGGKEEDNAGDGFFATFSQPDRAITCAAAIAEEVRTLGIEIRSGIHTGQTEDQAGKTHGIAVVIGARVMSLAEAGDILVTSTTKELVTGSGFGFEDLSAHELKGVPGTWQVFAVTGVNGEQRARPLPAAQAAERLTAIEPLARRERPRRMALIAVGSGLLLVIAAVVFATTRDDAKAPAVNRDLSAPAAAIVEIDPERTTPLLRSISIPVERHGVVPLPTPLHPLVVGQGGVWTIRWRSLFHVDPSRSEVRARITLDTGISFSVNLAEGLEEVWVATDDGLLEVNPATGDQRRVITIRSTGDPLTSADVTVGGRFVWLGLGDGRLIRFDPRSGREEARADLDAIDTIAFGHGAIWTLDAVGGTVSVYDPATMRSGDPIPITGDNIIVGDEGLWVLSRSGGTLTRIDPSTNNTSGSVQVGPNPTAITAGGGAIWVGDEDGVIRRVDEDTRQVTEVPFGAEARGLAYDDETGNLWVDVA